MKNRQPPGIEPGPLTLAVSALPPELWPPGDSHVYMHVYSVRCLMPGTCTCTCTCTGTCTCTFTCLHVVSSVFYVVLEVLSLFSLARML